LFKSYHHTYLKSTWLPTHPELHLFRLPPLYLHHNINLLLPPRPHLQNLANAGPLTRTRCRIQPTTHPSPTIKLIIGHGLSAVHYTLPIRLLAVNSELLTRDMSQMLSLNGATAGLHIKRKTPHDSSPEMTRKPFSELSADASTGRSEIPRVEAAKAEMVLQYSQMEMDSFGLFLRFMLTGDYPVGVDVGFAAVWVPWCSREAWVWKGMAWDTANDTEHSPETAQGRGEMDIDGTGESIVEGDVRDQSKREMDIDGVEGDAKGQAEAHAETPTSTVMPHKNSPRIAIAKKKATKRRS
ncbi:hypothetical protein IAQ61_002547, partial [Plenodomus lingam]|uniref:uncharacterized protein n=1 Tax=Leptosphaeria maculans TaxID=5022 RepID=UPI003324DCDC